MIRAGDFFPSLPLVAGAKHAARFADNEQAGVLDLSDAVQVVLVFVVQPVADIFPVLPAIGRAQQQAVGADGQAVVEVLEPDIQQRSLALQVLELLVPGLAAIAAGQYLRVVTDRPTVLFIHKKHGRQQLPGRHAGLTPGVALIIGKQNMPMVTHHDQPRPRMGDVQQQRA